MKPSIGRIVRYTSLGDADGKYPPEPHPAIITKVDPICLHVFYVSGGFDMYDVRYSETPLRGCWNWPPREEK